MTVTSVPPLRADHVGSLLRPARLRRARDRSSRGEISAEELRTDEHLTVHVRNAQRDLEFTSAALAVTACLSGTGGFSSIVEGNPLTRDEQQAKPALIVGTAAEVWG